MNYLEELFDEYIDELYGYINICGMDYPASRVLKEVDPTAYDVMYVDWSAEQDSFY